MLWLGQQPRVAVVRTTKRDHWTLNFVVAGLLTEPRALTEGLPNVSCNFESQFIHGDNRGDLRSGIGGVRRTAPNMSGDPRPTEAV